MASHSFGRSHQPSGVFLVAKGLSVSCFTISRITGRGNCLKGTTRRPWRVQQVLGALRSAFESPYVQWMRPRKAGEVQRSQQTLRPKHRFQ